MIVLILFTIIFVLVKSNFFQTHRFRGILLAGCFCNAFDAAIAIFGFCPVKILSTFIGQLFCSFGGIVFILMPTTLTALWFNPRKVGLTTTLGVMEFELGTAFGCFLPSVLVTNVNDMEDKAKIMAYSKVAVTCAILLIAIPVFKNPSSSIQSTGVNPYGVLSRSILKMLKDHYAILLVLSFGLSVGAFYSLEIMLGQIILNSHMDSNLENRPKIIAMDEPGLVGLVYVLAGCCGDIVFGFILECLN